MILGLFFNTTIAQKFLDINKRSKVNNPNVDFSLQSLKSAEEKYYLEEEQAKTLKDAQWQFLEKWNYIFNVNGFETSQEKYVRDIESSPWSKDSDYQYTYDANNNILVYEYSYSYTQSKEIFTYNDNDQTLTKEVQNYNNGWIPQTKVVFTYLNNDLLSKSFYNWDSNSWLINYITNCTVDAEGRVIEELTLDQDLNYDGQIDYHDHKKITYSYSDGKLIETETWMKSDNTTWFLHSKDEQIFNDDNLFIGLKSYKYDEALGDVELRWDETWEYDVNNNPTVYVYRFLEEDDTWYRSKMELEYDLSASASNYILPKNIDFDLTFNNKVIRSRNYNYDNNVWNEYRVTDLYYTGEVPTLIRPSDIASLKIKQNGKSLSFEWDIIESDYLLEVINVCGKHVFRQVVSNQETIQLNNIVSGIYIYRLSNGSKSKVGKLAL
ncbi:T9SS type A sorting domain-containing protein [Carboxylicivirga sp. N1Y90]|uniref:T9SS type A sorting domain-containing protein n=1 Tax=Carboxylicivirga fragile TaxID=3417571 RepID=UPI003D33C776|nr:T9SS type A sorting domain-containing protein [Marinilabiliaceae bacterium N1Y90]